MGQGKVSSLECLDRRSSLCRDYLQSVRRLQIWSRRRLRTQRYSTSKQQITTVISCRRTWCKAIERWQERTGRPIHRNHLRVCISQDTKPASRLEGLLRRKIRIYQYRLSTWPWKRYRFQVSPRKVFLQEGLISWCYNNCIEINFTPNSRMFPRKRNTIKQFFPRKADVNKYKEKARIAD